MSSDPRRARTVVSDPVSLSEAKAHLRVISDAEDAGISGFLEASRGLVETYTGQWWADYSVIDTRGPGDEIPATLVLRDVDEPFSVTINGTDSGDDPIEITDAVLSYDVLNRIATLELEAAVPTKEASMFTIDYSTAHAFEDLLLANTARLQIVSALYESRDHLTAGWRAIVDSIKRNVP